MDRSGRIQGAITISPITKAVLTTMVKPSTTVKL